MAVLYIRNALSDRLPLNKATNWTFESQPLHLFGITVQQHSVAQLSSCSNVILVFWFFGGGYSGQVSITWQEPGHGGAVLCDILVRTGYFPLLAAGLGQIGPCSRNLCRAVECGWSRNGCFITAWSVWDLEQLYCRSTLESKAKAISVTPQQNLWGAIGWKALVKKMVHSVLDYSNFEGMCEKSKPELRWWLDIVQFLW